MAITKNNNRSLVHNGCVRQNDKRLYQNAIYSMCDFAGAVLGVFFAALKL